MTANSKKASDTVHKDDVSDSPDNAPLRRTTEFDVIIENKELGSKAVVQKESVPTWEERGWTVVDDGSSDPH